MDCTEDPKEGSYDFFDDILKYIMKVDEIKSKLTSDEDNVGCESFPKKWQSKLKTKKNAETICKQFINLYNSLSHIKDKSDDLNYKRDSSFLNYWVNMILSEYRTSNNTCVNDFREQIEAHCYNTFADDDLSLILYDIKGEDFNKINELYNLYINYDKLKRSLNTLRETNKTSSLDYSNKCYDMYKKAETMHNGPNTQFYAKLRNFKSTYESLYPNFKEKEKIFDINFKRLPDDPYNNIITTSVLGSLIGLIPFLGVLYKFTPIGQFFRSKYKKNSKEYSKNDDEHITSHQGRYNIKYHSAG